MLWSCGPIFQCPNFEFFKNSRDDPTFSPSCAPDSLPSLGRGSRVVPRRLGLRLRLRCSGGEREECSSYGASTGLSIDRNERKIGRKENANDAGFTECQNREGKSIGQAEEISSIGYGNDGQRSGVSGGSKLCRSRLHWSFRLLPHPQGTLTDSGVTLCSFDDAPEDGMPTGTLCPRLRPGGGDIGR